MSLEWVRTLARQNEARFRALFEPQGGIEVTRHIDAPPDPVTIWLPRATIGANRKSRVADRHLRCTEIVGNVVPFPGTLRRRRLR